MKTQRQMLTAARTHSRTGLRAIAFAASIFCFAGAVPAQDARLSGTGDGEVLTVDDAPEMKVIAIARNVHIRGNAKEVFVWGGDITVEGRVEGDVAAFGGSVIQKDGAYIGGDVVIIGGVYKPESKDPLREPGRDTMMIGVFEDELRAMAQDPSQIFAPSLTWAFLAQRLLSILFWFIVTMVAATIAPGAISRASARFQLSPLKILGLGMLCFVLATAATVASIGTLPEYISVVIAAMMFALMMLAYGFGRVAMQVSLGKYIQRQFPGNSRSESLAIFIGVAVWAILLSIPFVWTLALIALFAAGIGLVATARPVTIWSQK